MLSVYDLCLHILCFLLNVGIIIIMLQCNEHAVNISNVKLVLVSVCYQEEQQVTFVKLQSPVCRSTILPPSVEDGTELPVSVQPIRLSLCSYVMNMHLQPESIA